MKSREKHIVVSFQVLLFLVVYLFVSLSYVFLLPSYAGHPLNTDPASNSIYKRQPSYQSDHQANYIQRTDKTTLDEKRRHVFEIVGSVATAFFFVFLGLNVSGTRVKLLKPQNRLRINGQYAYIPLRTFRI